MPLPQLTWNLVGPIQISSGTLLAQSVRAASKQFIMATLKSLIQRSNYWLVDVQDVTGSATEALVLKPNPALSQTPNLRIIATMNATGSLGGAAVASIMQDRIVGTPASGTANSLLVGFSPDISPNPTWVTGSWNSDRPWGTNVRWSKYWVAFQNTSAFAEQMYLIESSESLLIGLKARRGDTANFGALCGAIIQSADSGSGEQVTGSTGRVYGMTVVGGGSNFLGPDATWLTTNNGGLNGLGLFGLNTNINNSTYTGVFIVSGGVPNAPTATGAANSNTFELCSRAFTYTMTTPSDAVGDRGNATSVSESLIGIPMPVISGQSPVRFIGYCRQIYASRDAPALATILSGVNVASSSIIGYTWGADTLGISDTCIFSNY